MSTLLMTNEGLQAQEYTASCSGPKPRLIQQIRNAYKFATDSVKYGYRDAVDMRIDNNHAYATESADTPREVHHNIHLIKKVKGVFELAVDSVKYGYRDAVDMRRGYSADELAYKFAAKPERSDSINSNQPECNLHYHFAESKLTEIVDIYNKDSDEIDSVITEFASKIAQNLSSDLRRGKITRVLLDLEHPRGPFDLARQRAELSGNSGNLSEADREQVIGEWGNFRKIAVDVRHKILRALKTELAKENLFYTESDIAVLGEYIGKGAVGELFSCAIDENSGTEVVAKAHHVNNSSNGRQCLVGDYPPELITATGKSEYLISAFGTLYAKVLQGNSQRPRRFDFLEKIDGAVELKDYLRKYSVTNFSDYESEEVRLNCVKFLKSVFLPVLNGVKALHDEGLVHRDLKPENILVIPHSDEFGDLTMKMNDYDLVCRVGDDIKIWGGSPMFACPEWKDLKNINCSSDIYSLGMFLYEFFGGEMPEEVQALEPVKQVGYAALDKGDTLDLNTHPAIRRIIEDCLKRDPKKRPHIYTLIEQISNLVVILEGYSELEEGISGGDEVENFSIPDISQHYPPINLDGELLAV